MSGSENVALFTRPQGTYDGECGYRDTADGGQYHAPQHATTYADSSSASDESQGQPGYQRSASHILGGPRGSRDYARSNVSPPRVDPRRNDNGDNKKSFNDVLSDVHEKALEATGFGRLQWVLMAVLGMGIMGDAIELMVMAYILPGAERELCMDNQMKGWLGEYKYHEFMIAQEKQYI